MTRISAAPREEGAVTSLVEPLRAPYLAPQRERLPELGLDLRPCLRAPALVEHCAQEAVDAEPRVTEASVGVAHLVFGPLGSTVSGRQRRTGSGAPTFRSASRATRCACSFAWSHTALLGCASSGVS